MKKIFSHNYASKYLDEYDGALSLTFTNKLTLWFLQSQQGAAAVLAVPGLYNNSNLMMATEQI